MRILITGGAGFIGSALTKALVAEGHEVTILDSLTAQVHGESADFPARLVSIATCVRGDVRDRPTVAALLPEIEVVVHLAAETGTGQSMYEIDRYESVNAGGTATLLQEIADARPAGLKRLVVASSRAVYGEGLYRCSVHGDVVPGGRLAADLQLGLFEPRCPVCGSQTISVPTPENVPQKPQSVYGLTKQWQEQLTLLVASTLHIEAVALRYQNVFGPGQSLSNPYTGILSIFFRLAQRSSPINVFEDGLESRDFVFIDDVVRATVAAATADVNGQVSVNIGSGVSTTVMNVAESINRLSGGGSKIEISGNFRIGDVRHGCADLTHAKNVLNYSPQVSFQEGLRRFVQWASSNATGELAYARSLEEMKSRGLLGTSGAGKEGGNA